MINEELVARVRELEAELVNWRICVSPACEQEMRDLRAENDALRALLREACKLGFVGLNQEIDAALGGGKP